MRSQRNPDGTESHVWERWVAFSVDPLYLALFAKWDPGMIVRRHGHHSPAHDHGAGGRVHLWRRAVRRGHPPELPYGAAFGPFVAGPNGVELYEVMMGDPRSWSDEPEAMERILAERGVEQLPTRPSSCLPVSKICGRSSKGRADLWTSQADGCYPQLVATSRAPQIWRIRDPLRVPRRSTSTATDTDSTESRLTALDVRADHLPARGRLHSR